MSTQAMKIESETTWWKSSNKGGGFPMFPESLRPIEPTAAEIDSRQCQDSGIIQIIQLEFYHELTSTNLHLCKVESLSTWQCSKHWFPIPTKWHGSVSFLSATWTSSHPSFESTAAAEPCNRGSNQLGPRRLQNPNPCERLANSSPASSWYSTLPRWLDGFTVYSWPNWRICQYAVAACSPNGSSSLNRGENGLKTRTVPNPHPINECKWSKAFPKFPWFHEIPAISIIEFLHPRNHRTKRWDAF